jgi:hypothetical protein
MATYLESSLGGTGCLADGDVEGFSLGIVGNVVDSAQEVNIGLVNIGVVDGVESGELGECLLLAGSSLSARDGQLVVGLSAEDTSAGNEDWGGNGESSKDADNDGAGTHDSGLGLVRWWWGGVVELMCIEKVGWRSKNSPAAKKE